MIKEITNYAWMGEIYQNNINELKDYFLFLKDNGIHGIIYRSDRQNFKKITEIANECKLKIEAWYPTLICINKNINDISKELFAVSKNNVSTLTSPPFVDYYKWLCPNREEVFELIKKDLDSLIEIDTLDSIHLDYIRYCDLILPKGLWAKYNLKMDKIFNEYDFCYCKKCRELFFKENGIDPISINEGDSSYELWKKFRMQSVNNLVFKIKSHVHNNNKEISAAVFPGPSLSKKNVLQDWPKWDLDRYFPMNYNTFYLKNGDWIGEMVKEEVSSTTKEIISGIYLNGIDLNDYMTGLKSSIRNGAKGIAIFVPEEMKNEHWKLLKKL